MKYYYCPHCGLSIPDKGDTILKHKAYCKSSDENYSGGTLPETQIMKYIAACILREILK